MKEEQKKESLAMRSEELWDVLEDVRTRLGEVREEFNTALEDLEDMILEQSMH